jgi:hypothetical protein
MFISSNLLILWTCAKEDIDETNCWYLKRVNSSAKKPFHGPMLPRSDDTNSYEFILGDMLLYESKIEFDFEYSHQDKDILIIKSLNHRFAFQSIEGKFIHAPKDYIFTPTVDIAQGSVGGYDSRQKH